MPFSTLAARASHLVARAKVSADQAGVLGGSDPTKFNAANPITLFIIQLSLILAFTQLLAVVLTRLRQPRVIAEVLGGIILGPTVFGRIPGFTAHIFPQQSLSYLNLVSTIGLILFLFLVGLEVDVSVIKRNYRAAVSISLAGMILPFGLGCVIAIPIYHTFIDTATVNFGHFLLFVGTAMSITAFPVLCRILTECKLLDTTVGTVVLAAGVGNDVVGWILLALTVALVNASAGGAGSGVTAVYILLCAVGWTIVVCWPMRKAFYWLAVRSGSIENGRPTPFMMTLTLFMVFASAFVTDIIGVHAIFGGFVAAFAVPHEGGFAIALVDKLEDLITIIFLPLYFTLSGLKTNLGLLDDGTTWGYTILLCVVAFVGKFFGCASAARLNKFNVRESIAIGTLMSCKGLVELIVLNVGLAAGILDPRVFSMFVFMAIILTIITTPLTLFVYPSRYRDSIAATRATRKGSDGSTHAGRSDLTAAGVRIFTSKILVVLNRMEHLPAVMTVLQLLKSPAPTTRKEGKAPEEKSVEVDALRLVELTGRMSAVMQSAEQEDILRRDTVMQVFKTFGHLNQIPVSSYLAVVPQDSFASLVISHAADSQMVIVPWEVPAIEPMTIEDAAASHASFALPPNSPFESLFDSHAATGTPLYSHFLRRLFSDCDQDVGLFVHRGLGTADFFGAPGQHLLVTFFGGPDDRLALSLAVQLCQSSPGVTATILRVQIGEASREDDDHHHHYLTPFTTADDSEHSAEKIKDHRSAMEANQMTVHKHSTANGADFATVGNQAASKLNDDLAWAYFSSLPISTDHPTGSVSSSHGFSTSVPRVAFETCTTSTPLASVISRASSLASSKSSTSLIVVAGRGRRSSPAPAALVDNEIVSILAVAGQQPSTGAEMRKTMGDVATAVVVAGPAASFLVVQAGSEARKKAVTSG